MKKILLLLSISLLLLSNVSKADPNVGGGFKGNCIKNIPSLGWAMEYKYDFQSCLTQEVRFWAYYGGATYGPFLPTTFAGQTFFVIPTGILADAFNVGKCMDIGYYNECVQNGGLTINTDPVNGNDPSLPSHNHAIQSVCPCSGNKICVGNFSYNLNTENFDVDQWNQESQMITFEDNDYSYLYADIQNQILTNPNMIDCSQMWNNGINYISSYKVTDTWEVGGITTTYNNISNPNMYEAFGIKMKPFNFNYELNSFNGDHVCHTKKIEIGCASTAWLVGHEHSHKEYEFWPSATIYDCSVCIDICFSTPSVTNNIIIIHPDKPASGKNLLDDNNSNYKISPNPASTIININATSKIDETIKISLKDISGKTIKEYSKEVIKGNSSFSLDLNEIANGTYFINIVGSSSNHTTKLSIQK